MANVTALPVYDALTGSLPCEGAKALPITLDFTVANEYDFDLTQQQQAGQFTTLQGCFVDNSANGQPLTITMNVTDQPVIVPAGKQGYFTLLMCNPPRFTVNTAGAVQVYMAFMNFYVPPTVWG